jgi:hypothetical protein
MFLHVMYVRVQVFTLETEAQALIVYLFSSVAHVWVPGAKTTGPIAKKFGFS